MSQTFRIILFISDLLSPVWLICLMIILKRRGVMIWKAWGIASTFCLAQAYLVAKVVGWNLGGYLIVFLASVPSMVIGKKMIPDSITAVLFWIIPPFVFVIIPSAILLLRQKRKERE